MQHVVMYLWYLLSDPTVEMMYNERTFTDQSGGSIITLDTATATATHVLFGHYEASAHASNVHFEVSPNDSGVRLLQGSYSKAAADSNCNYVGNVTSGRIKFTGSGDYVVTFVATIRGHEHRASVNIAIPGKLILLCIFTTGSSVWWLCIFNSASFRHVC